MKLHRSRFEIVLDGVPAGVIDRKEAVEFSVPTGRHTLQISSGRFTKPLRSLDAADGTDVRFPRNGTIVWPRYVASLQIPKLGLMLAQE